MIKPPKDLSEADKIEERAKEYASSLNRFNLFSFDLANFAKKELESARLKQEVEVK